MTDYRAKLPKITWGAGFANTLNMGWQLDNVAAYSSPRDGFDTAQGSSGVEDSWDVPDDYYLEADFRYITGAGTASPLAVGWDGAAGVDAFLSWGRRKNQIRFYPDASVNTYVLCYLVGPMKDAPELEEDGTYRIRLILRNPATPFAGYGG